MKSRSNIIVLSAFVFGVSAAGAFLTPSSGAVARSIARTCPHSLPAELLPRGDGTTLPVPAGEAPLPKKSLAPVGQSHTATPWTLKLVALFHWAPLLPAATASYAVFAHSEAWRGYLGDSDLRVMLWMLAPLVMFASALPTIAMHVYEDWQIAPARDPATESFRVQDCNNDRLRLVAVSMLFCIITASNFATIFGYLGGAALLPLLGVAAVSAQMKGPVNQLLPKEFPNRHLVSPTPVGIAVIMIVTTAASICVLHDLGNHIPDGNALAMVATNAALPLISIGGMYEGFLGETRFNQWDHLIAIALVLAGNCAYAWAFWEIGSVWFNSP